MNSLKIIEKELMQDIRNIINIAEARVVIAVNSQMTIVLAELFLFNIIKFYDQFQDVEIVQTV